MATPTDITDLSTTAASNSPAGSEAPSVLDNEIRALASIIKQEASSGSNIASGGTITPPAAGRFFHVTGTTTITTIASTNSWNGRLIVLEFDGALTLTHHATNLALPGGANITTADGDIAIMVQESSGAWHCVSYLDASSHYIGPSTTDTLTNKTIVVANNTITTAASGNLAATELNAALAELDSDKADKVVPAADVNIAVLDGVTGNIEDGGQTIAEVITSAVSAAEGPSFRAYRATTNQSITTSTTTKIEFNAESYDTDSCFDSTTNYRFTPTTEGYYQVNLCADLTATSMTIAGVYIEKNGATLAAGTIWRGSTSNGVRVTAGDIVYMNGTTDYLEFSAYITGTTPVIAAGSIYTYVTAALVRTP